jgi:beta-lactamase class A
VIAPSAAPPPAPPAIVQPAPYQASFGLVTGTVSPGVVRIRVHAGRRLLADRPLRGRRFSLRVDLPARDATVRVTGLDVRGRRRTSSVGPVFGLPRAAEPHISTAHEDEALARAVRRLAASFRGTCGLYVQELSSGLGAAWNARARFPAASTLKLAVAMAVLRAHDGVPAPGSHVGGLLHAMLVRSDNDAANALEAWLGGSTSAGSHVVDALLRSIGLHDTTMYGGYETSDLRRPQGPIPIRVDSQPAFGVGKYTTAADLARLWRGVWLAAAGRGPVARAFPGSFTPADARYLLRLVALVDDPGKLDRFLPPGDLLLHKAGWLSTGRHDAGLVLWRGGAVLATVLTWTPHGSGVAADVFAGKVARATRDRFAG